MIYDKLMIKLNEIKLTKLYININMIIKNVKCVLLNTKFVSSIFNTVKHETSLPEKEDFYNHVNMKNITDADYANAPILKAKISVNAVNCIFKAITFC